MQRLKDKLKPCRFCGSSKVKFKNVLTTGMPLVHIECICGGGVYAPTAVEAVKKWNGVVREDIESAIAAGFARRNKNA